VRALQPPVGVTAPDRRHAGPRQGPGSARGQNETRGVTTRTEGEIDEGAIRGGDGAFGSLLRARRIRSGLTQGELSRRAGVSIRALRDIEQGRVRQPRRESVERLAAALGPAPGDAASPSAGPSPGRRRSGEGPDHLEIGVLGPLTVRRGGRPLDAGPLQQRCLLGLLALQPN
jgi:transcriptional regulator with XRE-family HTH domain